MSDQTLRVDPIRPPTFNDSAGNTWSVKLTLGLVDEILEATGVDLLPDDHNFLPFVQTTASARKTANLLWLIVRRQAERQGVDEPTFKNEMNAATARAGMEAIGAAIVFFYQEATGEKQAEAIGAGIETMYTLLAEQAEAMRETLAAQQTTKSIQNTFREATKVAQREMQSAIESCATSTPA